MEQSITPASSHREIWAIASSSDSGDDRQGERKHWPAPQSAWCCFNSEGETLHSCAAAATEEGALPAPPEHIVLRKLAPARAFSSLPQECGAFLLHRSSSEAIFTGNPCAGGSEAGRRACWGVCTESGRFVREVPSDSEQDTGRTGATAPRWGRCGVCTLNESLKGKLGAVYRLQRTVSSIIHCGRHMETTNVSFNRELVKEDVEHRCHGILIRKDEILKFGTTWMVPENIMLREISEAEKAEH
ncbi:uncharacterized protein LOC106695814 [Myotis lucifugus]|uniref:uncharacterized protein LOC106695814 n=1 Tax=Myotis lucifugus TaxID=59463 RepID=UPI0006D726FF|nr:uncharacterized protein LOC106695814 [Myotis lucifugus]